MAQTGGDPGFCGMWVEEYLTTTLFIAKSEFNGVRITKRTDKSTWVVDWTSSATVAHKAAAAAWFASVQCVAPTDPSDPNDPNSTKGHV